jgi:Icc-related predicted phosphoesterase
VFGDFASVLLEKIGEQPVRILAVTLWTDFELFGKQNALHCAKQTERALSDYQAIRTEGRLLRWHDTLAIHEKAIAWLHAEAAKANAAGEKVVVVSHHAPSLHSSLPVYKDDPVTAGFASNLEAFAAEQVDLAVHGHMHNGSDYTIGRCRVVANPRGYPYQRWNPNSRFENAQFNPELVVEV